MVLSKRSSEQALFKHELKPVSLHDVYTALHALAISKNDILLVHSDIGLFGLPAASKEIVLGSIIHALKDAVGEKGMVIMPTFTYSFERDEVFDIQHSRSRVGALTEYFRTQKDVARTKQPQHSVALWPANEETLKVGKDSFDDHSIFAKLYNLKGKILFFGVSFTKSCTFVHFPEYKHTVPYRYFRTYKGMVKDGNKQYADVATSTVKYRYFVTNLTSLENHLKNKGLLKEAPLGMGTIGVIDARALYDECLRVLDEDIYFYLKNDGFFKVFNACMYPVIKHMPWLARFLEITFSLIWYRKMP